MRTRIAAAVLASLLAVVAPVAALPTQPINTDVPGDVYELTGYTAGASAGGNAAGTAAFACYGSPTMHVFGEVAGGCAVAAAFAANVEYSVSFLWWDWSFQAAASISGCGGAVYDHLGIDPHVICEGSTTAGDQGASFGCQGSGGLLETPILLGCVGASASVASSDCAQAYAAGHASNLALFQEIDVAVTGASGGCGNGVNLPILDDIKDLLPDENAALVPPEEVPGHVIDKLRDLLAQDLLEAYNDATDSNAPQPVEALEDQIRSQLEAAVAAIEFENVKVTKERVR